MAWQFWRFKRTKQFWEEAIDELEAGLEEYASDYLEGTTWEIQRSGWDQPDATLVWERDGLQRNVHILIQGESWPAKLVYEGAVWRDYEGGERDCRYWPLPESQRTVQVTSLAEIAQSVDRDLPEAVDQINRLPLAMAAGA